MSKWSPEVNTESKHMVEVEQQSADIAAAWVDGVRIYTYPLGDDKYEEMVINRGGTVLDHYLLNLNENGETRVELHRLKSSKGKRVKAGDIPSGFGSGQKGRYNLITREIEV